MSKIRRVIGLLFLAGFLILGIHGIYISLFDRFFDSIAENELTLLEGIPRDVYITNPSRTQFIHFSVADQATDYSSDRPNFGRVLSTINDADRLRVWGSTKKTWKPLFGRPRDDFEVYKISVGDTPIVSYTDTVGHKTRSARVCLIVGCAFTAIPLYAICVARYQRRRKKSACSPSPNPAALSDSANSLEWSGMTDPGRVTQAGGLEDLHKLLSSTFVFPSQERKQMRDEARRREHATWFRRGVGVLVLGMGAVLGEMGLGITQGQSAAAVLKGAGTTAFLGLVAGPLLIYLLYRVNILGLYIWPWALLRFLVYACPAFFAAVDFTHGEWSWLKAGSTVAGSLAAAVLLSIFSQGPDGSSHFE